MSSEFPPFTEHEREYVTQLVEGNRNFQDRFSPQALAYFDRLTAAMRETFKNMDVEPDRGTVAALCYFLDTNVTQSHDRGTIEQQSALEVHAMIGAVVEFVFGKEIV